MNRGASKPHFGRVAPTYDRLRPTDENWRELLDVLIAEGDLLGRRVLDIGCGTGSLTVALAERGARVWGVDQSSEMLAEARRRPGPRVAFKRASAEALPFKDGWFERAVGRQIVHLVDRARAFEELARVLGPDGRAVLATFQHSHFERFWLAPYFPSLVEIDRARFPEPPTVEAELSAAGFRATRTVPLTQESLVDRETALERIRGRFISTLALLPEPEFEAGLARAERELPREVAYTLDWAVIVGRIEASERPMALARKNLGKV